MLALKAAVKPVAVSTYLTQWSYSALLSFLRSERTGGCCLIVDGKLRADGETKRAERHAERIDEKRNVKKSMRNQA